MRTSVDLYIYDRAKLVADLKEFGANNEDLLNRILERCGNTFGDKYVLLHNEFYESNNPYFIVAELIDAAFNITDSIDIIIRGKYKSDGLSYKSEGISYLWKDDEMKALGIPIGDP